jgi:hypothetical protein
MTDFDTSPIIIEDSTPPSVRGERLTGRYGMVSLVGASLRSEAGIRDAIAKLTAWLDAPRLAARFRCAEKDHPCGWEGTGAGVGVVEGDNTPCCPDCGGDVEARGV